MPEFAKLLVANRAEIACRVLRTARAMGYETVAVFSAADRDAPHVRLADEAAYLGPAAAADSYLNIQRILDVARQAGADAVHPGYGFLSENAEFAEACARAGLTFVGPPAEAMRMMADKARAKALMQQAGVPIVPGFWVARTTSSCATRRCASASRCSSRPPRAAADEGSASSPMATDCRRRWRARAGRRRAPSATAR
jgi:acetyl/propionyl-CoA carboxylase alpha subunit